MTGNYISPLLTTGNKAYKSFRFIELVVDSLSPSPPPMTGNYVSPLPRTGTKAYKSIRCPYIPL
ncbi:hypothetical protein J6590_079043 [Homalodisca vitripennis]|nr:hypothetical protein J6590_079043 [Homalodisca vitripennis]